MIRRLLLLLLAPLGALLLVGTILRVLAPAPVSAAGGDVHCVVPMGAPLGPFAPCTAVFDDAQAAADAAPPRSEIRLAAGTYTEVHDLNGLRQVLLLGRDVELSGGWMPPFDYPPDPEANPTVLDAGYGGRVVYISGSVSVTISGVTLQRGDATGLGGYGDPAENAAGGGLYANGATLLLSRTVISGNRALDESVAQWSLAYGGGLFLVNGHLTLRESQIIHNVGTLAHRANGGGVALIDGTAVLSGNLLAENIGLLQPQFGGQVAGGALYAEGVVLQVVSNTFRHNRGATPREQDQDQSQVYGGAFTFRDCVGEFSHNVVEGNWALHDGSGFGGGGYVESGLTERIASSGAMTISHNLFRKNIAVDSRLPEYDSSLAIGGGLFVDVRNALRLEVTYNHFLSNTAGILGSASPWGGGAAIFMDGQSTANVSNNAFLYNRTVVSPSTGPYDGGAYSGILFSHFSTQTTSSFVGNEVSHNYAGPVNRAGCVAGGLFGSIHVRDTVLRNNRSDAADTYGMICASGPLQMENVALVNNTVVSGTPGLILEVSDAEKFADTRFAHLTLNNNRGGNGVAVRINGRPDSYDPFMPAAYWFTNTLIANHAVGISAAGGTTTTLNGVLWHNVPVTATVDPTATFAISNQFSGDPALAADGYHLLPGSAAIDRGVLSGVAFDIDGEARDERPDVGADERPATVICVVPPGEPLGPFAPCTAVFDDAQAAADAAPPRSEIRLAAGTYTEVHDLNGLRQVLLLGRDVELSGGWMPPFDYPPDPEANPTVLDAGYAGRVVYISDSISVSITGVTLQRGNAIGLGGVGNPAEDAAGGGLYANGATLFLGSSVISGNRAMGNSASEWNRASGGGVALIDSTAILSGNHFAENVGLLQPGKGSRVEGGALYAEASELRVVSNTFRHNRSTTSPPTPDDSLDGYGGAFVFRNSTGYFSYNVVENNRALNEGLGYGGGGYIETAQYGDPTFAGGMTLTSNLFMDNVAVDMQLSTYEGSLAFGGGLYVDGNDALRLELRHNRFLSNTALTGGPGGFSWGGGAFLSLSDESSAAIADNEFRWNSAAVNGATGGGSGIVVSDLAGGSTFIRNVVSDNTMGPVESAACAAALIHGPNVVRDNIFRDNFSAASQTDGMVCVGRLERMENVALVNNEILSGTPGLIVQLSDETHLGDTRASHLTLYNNRGGNGAAVTIRPYGNVVNPEDLSSLWMSNTLIADHAVGISVAGGMTATLNGVLWHNVPVTASVSPAATFIIDNQVVGDPRLGPDGYHLQGGSAAINWGVPAGVPRDIDGDPRQGLPDLGADEWLGIRLCLPVIRRP